MKGQVQVYRNLHKTLEDGTKVYSVKNDKGIVEDHVTEIAISRPILRVGPKGNQRVRDEQGKNVHAVIRGCMVNSVWAYADMDAFEKGHAKDACDNFKKLEMDDREGYEWREVLYNPYKYKTFVTRDTNPFRSMKDVIEPIYTASNVIIGPRVWAQVPVKHENN